MHRREHRQFFGDGEKSFVLDPDVIVEVERVVGRGIGAVCKAMFSGEFKYFDVAHVIRLGLIGGGTSPEDANALVNLYVHREPIEPSYSLAVSILEAAYFGAPKDPLKTASISDPVEDADA